MEDQVLYRKWRPKSLTSILGQKEVVQILSNSIISDRLSHSFVFSGPSGTGKTSTARVFAKSINCETAIEKNLSIDDCICNSCNEINNYSSQSIIELDAASSIRQVEDLTEVMLEKINFLPGANNYKVYILDEVHMLSRHSFNALLKTLEEPPKHLIIILVTTDPEKIPQTIMSRCQILEFKSIGDQEIIDKLIKIANSENKLLSNENAQIIAAHSEGSLRNAENLLEKCLIRLKQENLDKESIETVLGIVNSEIPISIIENILDKNLDTAFRLLNDQFEKHSNFESITNSFRELCRNLIHYKYKLNSNSETEKLGQKISVDQIKTISNVVNEIKHSSYTNPKLSLEIMILNIFDKLNTQNSTIVPAENKMNELDTKKNIKNPSITEKSEDHKSSVHKPTSKQAVNNDDNILLKNFIEQFSDLDWSWKVKTINNYNINENTLNLLFTHQSQIDYINQEISNPVNLKLFTEAVKKTWNKDLQFNFTLNLDVNFLANQIQSDNNEKTKINNLQKTNSTEIFYKEASKYGSFNKLKEIKNES